MKKRHLLYFLFIFSFLFASSSEEDKVGHSGKKASSLLTASLEDTIKNAPLKEEKKTSLAPIIENVPQAHVLSSPAKTDLKKGDHYTINFQGVSIIEYIRFVAKITHANFIFNEEDLQFNVTIVSDEATTPQYLLSSLVQMLRIHGLTLLEENGNLLIHKNADVKELAQIVSGDEDSSAALVTRVFQLKNVQVATLVPILKPMISKDAQLETLVDSQTLIITDINTNIKKIQELLAALDSYQVPLIISTYKAKNNSPEGLTNLAQKIMAPMVANHPFQMTPDNDSQNVYIITTEKLTNEALNILKKIDQQTDKNHLLYQLVNQNPDQALSMLNSMLESLQKKDSADQDLIQVLKSVMHPENSSSLLFNGTPGGLEKVKKILASIDVKESSAKVLSGFFTYIPTHVDGKQLLHSLKDLAKNLSESKITNKDLIHSIKEAKWVESIAFLIFTGDVATLDQIKLLLKDLDTEKEKYQLATHSYYLYKLENASGDVVEENIDLFLDKVKANKSADRKLVEVLENIKWIQETNSLLLTGSHYGIEEAKKVIEQYDKAHKAIPQASNFFMYYSKNLSPHHIQQKMKDIALSLEKSDLADIAFLNCVKTMKYVESSKALVFTGAPAVLDKIKTLLEMIDVSGPMGEEGAKNYFIYHLINVTPDRMIKALQSIALDLEKAKTADPSFISALNSVKYNSETQALIFTGSEDALKKIKPLVEKFDVAQATGPQAEAQFFIYKPVYYTAPSLENILKDFSQQLESSGFANKKIYYTIQNMRYIEKTESLLFSGDVKTLEEVKVLLSSFDVPSKDQTNDSIQSIDNTSFLVYKLQYHKGDEIQSALRQVAQELLQTKPTQQHTLVDAINTLQWIQVTNSLICTGEQDTMNRLKEIIRNLDVPLKQVFIEVLVIETTLGNVLNFGLEWGGKSGSQRLATGALNFPSGATTNTGATSPNYYDSFAAGIDNTSATKAPDPKAIPFSNGFDLGVIGDIILHKGKSFISLGALLSALQKDSETTIVLTPKIITQDGKTTSIFIGQNIPYTGSAVQNQGDTTTLTSNLEYRDVGMKMVLTPVLGNSNVVTLSINLEKTEQLPNSSSNVSVGNVQGITTSKANMDTTVHIPNKHFLILSGMLTDRKEKAKQGIPCLGGLPFIGHAFSKDTTNNAKSNLVIFIRPHIINSFKDMQDISNAQEDFFRESQGSANLEKVYDEGVELLKMPEDE
jgi:type III secretion protein C